MKASAYRPKPRPRALRTTNLSQERSTSWAFYFFAAMLAFGLTYFLVVLVVLSFS